MSLFLFVMLNLKIETSMQHFYAGLVNEPLPLYVVVCVGLPGIEICTVEE